MKFSRLVLAFSLLLPVAAFALWEWSRIDMGVSPIKHEFSVGTGKTITRTITFFNNSNTTYNIYLTAEDCFADDKAGTPKCRAATIWSGSDSTSLATWVHFEWATRFTVPARWEKKINFSVTPPADAIPGGHYGAIFLNNPEGWDAEGNTVKMVRRAWVLLLVNVPGRLVYDTSLGEIEIETPLFSAPDESADIIKNPRSLPTWEAWLKRMMSELDPRLDSPILLDTSDFSVSFTIPVKNSWNIHVLPVGRIELYDEDGTILKSIGKESLKSPEWVFLWEKIVDYLPINDEGGNVLPGSDRIYSVLWRGFAYKTIDWWREVVKFLSPWAYYTSLTENNARVIYPWEKLKIFIASRKIHAKIHLEYLGENNTPVPFDLEKDIYVKYNFIDKGLNLWAILLFVLIVFIAWRLLRKKEDRIEFLEEEVDEFEHAKALAKKALAKKAIKSEEKPSEPSIPTVKKVSAKKPKIVWEKVSESLEKPKKTPTKKTPAKKPVAEKSDDIV